MNRCGVRGGYNSESYVETLREGLVPLYEPGLAFQQDNAPIHTSAMSTEWLEEHGVWVIDWPPYSPDLNPIEHVWWDLKKRILEKHSELVSLGQSDAGITRLQTAAKEVWQELDQSFFQSLVDSMPRRLQAVRSAKGWHTKYQISK